MSGGWRGTFTAIVTPFRGDGSVDEERLAEFVAFQLDGGVEGIVPCGTTGEGATLDENEQVRVVEIAVDGVRKATDSAGHRAKVIAGAGGNATARVIALAKRHQAAGADAILSVVPYYNKPCQEGLFQHFSAVADALDVPVVLYNVPGRTSANMLADTTLRLAEHPNICAVKEASGNLVQVAEIIRTRPEGFSVLSGEDNLTWPLIALGGDGSISVVGNEVPGPMSDLVRAGLAGDGERARELHYRLLPLMNANFYETNPQPVKAALAMMGKIEENFRLPLIPLSDANRPRLRAHLVELGLVSG
jgi:4-hydroxy-tetrahydrodipicolinate synthase